MRRVLAVLTVLLLCIAVLGFFMGWFHLSSKSADGKSNVTLTVDQDQIQKDKERAVEKVQGMGGGQPK